MRFLAGLALLGLAVSHLMIWLPRFGPGPRTFDPRDSELLRRAEVDDRGARRTAVVGAIGTAVLLTLAAAGAAAGAGWASELAVTGATLSILLAILFFHPWLLVLVVVDLAVVSVAL